LGNDIENGFDVSRHDALGVLLDYDCNEHKLDKAVRDVRNLLDGVHRKDFRGPPQPISHRDDPA